MSPRSKIDFSGQLQANGALIASLWRKVAQNVEAGIETTLQAGMVPITDPLMGTPIGIQPTVEVLPLLVLSMNTDNLYIVVH